MILLLVAPPGAGKGTQAARLAAHYGIAHLSSGELLRHHVAAGSEVGLLTAAYLERGDLVPDEVVVELMGGPVLDSLSGTGCVLDGFPRSLAQAALAEQLLERAGTPERPLAVHLEVREDELRRRLLGRAAREGRADDTAATITHRLELYVAETEPLLAFYGERAALVRVAGEGPAEEVFAATVSAIDSALSITGGAIRP